MNSYEEQPPTSARDNFEKELATPNSIAGQGPTNQRKSVCCSKLVLAKVCIAVGALLVVVGIVWGTMVPSVVNHKVDDMVPLHDFDQDTYTDKFGDCKDCNPFYYSYYPFNVTNANEFLEGATKLQVQELGPYVYRKKVLKQNVRLNATSQIVTFQSYNVWQFDSSKSCNGCTSNDVVTGFEVGYMAIMSAAGGEYNFLKTLLMSIPGSTETEATADAKIKMGGKILLKLLYGYNSLSPEAMKNLGTKAALALASQDLATLMALKMEGFDYNGMLVKRTVQQWAVGYPSMLAGLVLGNKYKNDCKGPGQLLERCANCVGDECNAIGALCNQCQKAQVVVQMNPRACGQVRDIYSAAYGEAEAKAFTAMTCGMCDAMGLCAAQVPGAMEKSGFDWSHEQPPAVFLMESAQKTGAKDFSVVGDYVMYENATEYAIYAPVQENRNPTADELTNFYGNCSQWTTSSNFSCIKIIGNEGFDFDPQGVTLTGIPSTMDQAQRQVFVSHAFQNVTVFNTRENVEYEGINLVRFRPATDLLNPTPLNAKYGTGIPYKGVQPLSFMYGFLSYVSYPFYLYGDEDLLEMVDMTMIDGTKATKENIYENGKPKKAIYDRLSTFLDVEPASGKTMYAKKRMQGSVSMNKSPRDATMPLCDIMHPKIKPEVVFPIYWGEESGYITTQNADRVKSELVAVTKTFLPVFLVSLIVGLVVFAFGVFSCIRERRAMHAATKGGMEVVA